jgi:O-antigen ligase
VNPLIQRYDHKSIYGLGHWHSLLILLLALSAGLVLSQLPLMTAVFVFAGVTFLMLSVIQPLVPLSAAIIAGPFGAYENIFFGDSVIESGQIIFFVALASWLGHRMIIHQGRLTRPPLFYPLLIFILVTAFSLLAAGSFDSGIKEVAKWVEIWLVMIMVIDQASNLKSETTQKQNSFSAWKSLVQERWFLIMLLVAGAIQALIGIWQFAFQESGPDHFLILDRFYRAYGTFMQPNPFGGFMSISAFLAIGSIIGVALFVANKVKSKAKVAAEDWYWILFLIGLGGLVVVALIMSWSRGAWLGFGAGMAVTLLFLPKRRWVGVSLLISAIFVLLIATQLDLLPTSISSRISGLNEDLQFGDVRGVNFEEENYAVIERLAHWQSALEMAKDNIWLGVGFGNYESAYPEYQLLNWPFALGHAHNYYLNVLAETGIIGLLTYLVFWVLVFIQLLRILRSSQWPHRGLALGLLAAWTALSVHHLVDKLYVNNMFIFMGVMLGLQQILAMKDDNSVR